MSRFLQSTTRTVRGDAGAYLDAWSRVRAAAESAQARAWIFVATDDPAVYIEFVEWQQQSGLAALPADVGSSLAALERFGAGVTRQWREP